MSSLYKMIIKHINNKKGTRELTTKDNKNFVLLGERYTKEELLENDIKNKSLQFITYCFEKEKGNFSSIQDIIWLSKDIFELKGENTTKNIVYENSDKILIYSNDNIETKRFGYVGLKNLSATCYMNSVLQQLFMIYALKYAILSISEDEIKNDILRQMQNLFANLELSESKYYDTTNLCRTKIFNNKPIDVRVQQDSKEFYDSACDSLETCLKNTKYKYIIDDSLMGCMHHSIKCESCGYTSNKFENFCDLSLEIKDINNLKESLDKLTQPETVSDFNCNNCGKTVQIEKKITLSKLPNTLFLHLKRFEYGAIIQKIYSEFNYPIQLNLKEYCTEYSNDETYEIYQKKDEYYEYVLKGVVRHSGSAYGGHYISFIDVNREGEENTMKENNERDKKRWLKFDDSNISEFDDNYLRYETLGDERTTNTAYLLVYERIEKSPIKIVIKNFRLNEANRNNIINFKKEEINKINKKYDIYNINNIIKKEDLYKKIFHNETDNEYFKYIPYYSIRKEIPQKLYDEIKEYNRLMGKGDDDNINNDNSDSFSKIDSLSKVLEDSLFSTFDSDTSFEEIKSADINNKYYLITIYITLIFNKISQSSVELNDINSKLDSIQMLIKDIYSSKEEPEFDKILDLSKILITEEKLKIIFIKDRGGRDTFNEKNVKKFRKLTVSIIEKISKSRNKNKDAKSEIVRIANILILHYQNLKNQKSIDQLFNRNLLGIITNDEIMLKILLENHFINNVLDNIENDRKEHVFNIVKTIIKSTKDYYNKNLFYFEEDEQENKKIEDRPELNIKVKNELRIQLINTQPSLIKYLFLNDNELLLILTKILYYNETEDFYSMKFFYEYYRTCKCFILLHAVDKIIDYFSVYLNLIDIKDQNAIKRMKVILGYPRLIIKSENPDINIENDDKYYYDNINIIDKSIKESKNLRIKEEIDKEIIENEMNNNYIGEQIIKNNNGDQLTNVYEYNNTSILDDRIIGLLTEIFYHESNLKGHKNELIYLLMDKCFKNGGNFFIFKYLYLLPSRSIYYDNLFEELFSNLDEEYKQKLAYINNIKEYFITRIEGKPYDITNIYLEYNPNIKVVDNFKGYNAEYLPGEVLKKEIQIVTQTEFIELIKIEYYTKVYPINDLRNLYKDRVPPKKENNEIVVQNSDKSFKGIINIEDEDNDNFSLLDKKENLDKNFIKKFKSGKKITIRFNNDKKNNKEEEIKTIISYIIINKKPLINKFDFRIKFRPDLPPEIKSNCFMNGRIHKIFIDARSYKIITHIQRKSLNSPFLESDDLYFELKASSVNEDELTHFFNKNINN